MSDFLNEVTLQQNIERIVKEKRLTYLEAMIYFLEENDMEPEQVKKLISSNLRDKIRLAAVDDGLLKAGATLPI